VKTIGLVFPEEEVPDKKKDAEKKDAKPDKKKA
jgi:hypothetical protein